MPAWLTFHLLLQQNMLASEKTKTLLKFLSGGSLPQPSRDKKQKSRLDADFTRSSIEEESLLTVAFHGKMCQARG